MKAGPGEIAKAPLVRCERSRERSAWLQGPSGSSSRSREATPAPGLGPEENRLLVEYRRHLKAPAERLDVMLQGRQVEVFTPVLVRKPLVDLIKRGLDSRVIDPTPVTSVCDALLRLHQPLVEPRPTLVHRLRGADVL